MYQDLRTVPCRQGAMDMPMMKRIVIVIFAFACFYDAYYLARPEMGDFQVVGQKERKEGLKIKFSYEWLIIMIVAAGRYGWTVNRVQPWTLEKMRVGGFIENSQAHKKTDIHFCEQEPFSPL